MRGAECGGWNLIRASSRRLLRRILKAGFRPGFFKRRQEDGEGRAIVVQTLRFDAAAMLQNNPLGDGQSQTSPPALGGEERMEKALHVFRADPGPAIFNAHA